MFLHVLANTALANVTTAYVWFALTFWVYLETRSVLATGLIGGAYMLFVAFGSILFGSIVDHHRKLRVMVLSGSITLAAFAVAGAMYLLLPEPVLLDLGAPWLWLFMAIILAGSVVEHMRNIALSTTVTILVADARRANANGLVGTVQGLAMIVTSVFSGLSIGFLGMGWTIAIAIGMLALSLGHLVTLRIPEDVVAVDPDDDARGIDLRGSVRAVLAIGGLFALIIFSTFNNLIGGVYMALMDPYGLELFDVQTWGMIFGFASTGFVVGGLVIARFGLGKRPIRTLLIVVAIMGVLGAVFTIREWWWLYALGIWAYMALIPAAEAAEQTIIQRVVPLPRQGRVFGFAMAFESAAAPIAAFLIAPLAEFLILPWARSPEGAAVLEPVLGVGIARGIALVFLCAGALMVVAAGLAFLTTSYRRISDSYEASAPGAATAGGEAGSDAAVTSVAAPAARGGAVDARGAPERDGRSANGETGADGASSEPRG
ncbi:MFS transporter [Agrococcus sp. Ld7]|uniref:MFS transporter n=1 Tax=Agrococcus sp. Ld7 TaxID=649148 RepID=UPI00386F43B3